MQLLLSISIKSHLKVIYLDSTIVYRIPRRIFHKNKHRVNHFERILLT